MTVVEWMREWWAVPLVMACCSLLLVVLNLAVIRDRYIVESGQAMHAGYLIAAGHLVFALAAATLVLPIRDYQAELLVGSLLAGVALNSTGSIVVIAGRIFERWNVEPWAGDERGGGHDRRVSNAPWPPAIERRKGERRASVTRPAPLDERPSSAHSGWGNP